MRIYISLPITGQEEKAREKADLIKAYLSRMGHEPVNPFENYAGKEPTYFDHLCYDLRALADCDAAVFCNGWEKSPGCRVEHYFASTFGKKIFFESNWDNSQYNEKEL